MFIVENFPYQSYYIYTITFFDSAQLAGVVEYADCICAER